MTVRESRERKRWSGFVEFEAAEWTAGIRRGANVNVSLRLNVWFYTSSPSAGNMSSGARCKGGR